MTENKEQTTDGGKEAIHHRGTEDTESRTVYNEISGKVIETAIEVHWLLSSGLIESHR